MTEIETTTHGLEPKGASFQVVPCDFTFGERLNVAQVNLPDDKVLDWPVVYILANDDSAYVGQTTSVINRLNQHGANEERRDFRTANIIFNEEFNASVITDYEHRLIDCMHADGRYRLTNKNNGLTDSNYFSKAQYSEMFDALWDELRGLELAVHTLDEIEESEVFKYSPYKGLNVDQRVALDKIMGSIEAGLTNAKPLVVEGMPGTGKTVLAIYLLKMLKDDPRYAHLNIRLLEPVTSLRKTLQSSVRSVAGLDQRDIIAPADLAKSEFGYRAGEKNFDIVLVDEAHRLKQRVNLGTQFGNYDKVNRTLGLPENATQMDWILDQVKLPVFFYDPLQIVGPSCLSRECISDTLGESLKHPIRLDSQMRVKGGKRYLDSIEAILNGRKPEPMVFDNYEFVLHDDFGEFLESFEEHYREHNLSRIVAGYAWPWVSKGNTDPEVVDIEFDGCGLRWNCTYENWVGKGFDNDVIAHEVGCIHSIQGYDLSYAYVIIGEDVEFNEETGKLRANKEKYFDRNGKATATQEELTRYIKNIYYVLLTRGIYGTHVYVADSRLKEYFKSIIHSEYSINYYESRDAD